MFGILENVKNFKNLNFQGYQTYQTIFFFFKKGTSRFILIFI